jgi:hypothetical protein
VEIAGTPCRKTTSLLFPAPVSAFAKNCNLIPSIYKADIVPSNILTGRDWVSQERVWAVIAAHDIKQRQKTKLTTNAYLAEAEQHVPT